MIRGWMSRYSEIVKEFGFSIKQDHESAILLNSIINKPIGIKSIRKIIENETVFVIGSGPSLSESIAVLKKYPDTPKIIADSALWIILREKIRPDIVMTDLDGNEDSLRHAGKTDSIIVVHAHGDNISKLHLAEAFGNCLGTTQGRPFGKLYNFGGFTDGDRAVFIADSLGAKKIVLFGMDLKGKIGDASRTKMSEKKLKLKKLKKAKMLLQWLASKSSCELYTTSGHIAGFKTIRYGDLSKITNTQNVF